jgi:hypothetical protein
MGTFMSKQGGDGGDAATHCTACREALGERYTSALGGAFHPACFTCGGKCGTELGPDVEFYVREGAPWCEECFVAAAQRCHACDEPVLQGRVFTTHGKPFHEACFRCAECDESVADAEQFFTDVQRPDGAKGKERVVVLCRACNFKGADEDEEASGGVCSWCEEPVEDKGISALNRRWHDECFRCNDCEAHLLEVKDGFFHVDGKLYCRDQECVFARDHEHKGTGRVPKRKRNQLLEVITSPMSGIRRVRQRTA